MTKKQIAEKYVRKYPDMQTHTLANLLLKKESAYFHNLESARNCIRVVRGKKNNITQAVPDLIIDEKLSSAMATIPMPESEDLQPYKLPVGFNNFILAGDFHIPNHRIVKDVTVSDVLRYRP